MRRKEWLDLLTIAGFCAFFCFYGLAAFGLTGADEPRYAQIAREMLQRHDLVTPILYGQPWLEKPVLYYWLAAVFYKLFGVSDWAARLPSAALTFAMVFAIYFHVRRFRPGAELNAALMTVSCTGVIGFSHSASTDLPLAALFVIGMLAWHAWFATGRRLWLAAFYLMMALATLAKGPVAPVLAGLVIIVFAIRERDTAIVLRTLWPPGIVLYLAAVLPWYVAVQLRNPQFFREFILQHNLERFAVQNLYHHRQPFWYYLPVVLLAVMPWTVYVLAAAVEHLRHYRERAAAATHDPLPRFLFLWIVVIVLFFSFSQSKLPGYILPAIPPCTILVADWLQRRGDKSIRWWRAALHAAGVAALTVAVVVAPFLVAARQAGQPAALPPPLRTFSIILAIAIFAGVMLTLGLRGFSMLRFVTLAPMVFAMAWLIRAGGPTLDHAISARLVARDIAEISGPGRPVALYSPGRLPPGAEGPNRDLEYGLAFYRDQPIPRYDRGQIPASDHLVVARAGAEHDVAAAVAPRRVSRIGSFPAQRLDFFWISPPPEEHQPQPPSEEHHHHH